MTEPSIFRLGAAQEGQTKGETGGQVEGRVHTKQASAGSSSPGLEHVSTQTRCQDPAHRPSLLETFLEGWRCDEQAELPPAGLASSMGSALSSSSSTFNPAPCHLVLYTWESRARRPTCTSLHSRVGDRAPGSGLGTDAASNAAAISGGSQQTQDLPLLSVKSDFQTNKQTKTVSKSFKN